MPGATGTSGVLPRADLEHLDATGVLANAAGRFGSRLTVACSFQKEASVIMDLLVRHHPGARFFTLDTDVLFDETYEIWRQVEEHYGIEVEVFRGPSLGRQAALHGDRLWERDPDACCALRKVEPLNRALAGAEAWVSGLRRDQSPSRAATRSWPGTTATACGTQSAGRLVRG
jgi:phosphoadenosine phosphosulfate reductase